MTVVKQRLPRETHIPWGMCNKASLDKVTAVAALRGCILMTLRQTASMWTSYLKNLPHTSNNI